MRIQQREVEFGQRMRIGLWLKERVAEGEVVYLEPLGYIGYFSDATMRDWPGLVAPDVVRLTRARPLNRVTMIAELRPDWLVLRDWEAEMAGDYRVLGDYELAEAFSVLDRINGYDYIPGRGYLEYDASYKVYKRKCAAAAGPAG
jgi:hypothetical protein